MTKLLRYLWASPATLVGVVAALPCLLSGGRCRREQGVLEFHGGALAARLRRFNFGAITFGHVIIGLDAACLAACRSHEHVHVRQYERWGVLFFPLYLGSSAWQWMRGRDPYRDNRFEKEAIGLDSPRLTDRRGRLSGNDITPRPGGGRGRSG